VSEPFVQTVGTNKVVVQLPGVTDPSQAERILGGTAQLEFRRQKAGTEGEFRAEYSVKQGLDQQLAQLRKTDPGNQSKIQELLGDRRKSNQALLKLFEPIGLTGQNLDDARPTPNQAGNAWEVALRFDEEGVKNLPNSPRLWLALVAVWVFFWMTISLVLRLWG